MKDLKVIFMGTPEFACPVLEMLIEHTNVVLVVTQPDKEVGRNKVLTPSPIKETALKYNIDVFQPVKLNQDYEMLSDINPDLIVTCAYGQIVSENILNIPRLGCINVHASLLPNLRGASPIQYALLNGLSETGVSIMYMDKGMDTGDIISMESIPISINDNFESLHDKLSILGKDLLLKTLPSIYKKENQRIKQDNDKATYSHLIKREDELIDFNDTSLNIYNKIRAFSPFPLAYFKFNDITIKIVSSTYEIRKNTTPGKINILKQGLEIETLDGVIKPLMIKPEGKKIMDIKSFINGLK